MQPAVGLQRYLARHQALRVDHPPIGEIGRDIDVGDVLDKGLGIDGLEQAGAFEIGAHHAGDIGAGLGLAGIARA